MRPFLVGDGDRVGRAMNSRALADRPQVRTLELSDGNDARAIVQRPNGRDELATLIDRADRDARLLEASERFARIGTPRCSWRARRLGRRCGAVPPDWGSPTRTTTGPR